MKRTLKIISLIALCLLLVGTALGFCGWMAGGTFSFAYIPKEHKFISGDDESFSMKTKDLDRFTDIVLNADSMNVKLLTGDKFSITYPESTYNEVTSEVKNDKLTVTADSRHKITFLSFGTRQRQEPITITVPKDALLNTVSYVIKLGDCEMKNLTCEELLIENDFGDIKIENLNGGTADIKAKNGDVVVSNSKVNVAGFDLNLGNCDINNLTGTAANLNLDSGNCKMADSSIDELTYEGNLGNFTSANCILKIADLTLDSGDCTITALCTDKLNADLHLGNCELSLLGEKKFFDIHLDVDLGTIKIDGEKQGSTYTNDNAKAPSIDITNNCGDIDVNFGH